jgi:hypothetical protein
MPLPLLLATSALAIVPTVSFAQVACGPAVSHHGRAAAIAGL